MKKKLVVVVGIVMALSVTGTWAQDDIIENVIAACEPEIEAYCSQVTLGEGRLLACFYAHEDNISHKSKSLSLIYIYIYISLCSCTNYIYIYIYTYIYITLYMYIYIYILYITYISSKMGVLAWNIF